MSSTKEKCNSKTKDKDAVWEENLGSCDEEVFEFKEDNPNGLFKVKVLVKLSMLLLCCIFIFATVIEAGAVWRRSQSNIGLAISLVMIGFIIIYTQLPYSANKGFQYLFDTESRRKNRIDRMACFGLVHKAKYLWFFTGKRPLRLAYILLIGYVIFLQDYHKYMVSIVVLGILFIFSVVDESLYYERENSFRSMYNVPGYKTKCSFDLSAIIRIVFLIILSIIVFLCVKEIQYGGVLSKL